MGISMLRNEIKTQMNYYNQTSNISDTLVGNKLDHSDVIGASPLGVLFYN